MDIDSLIDFFFCLFYFVCIVIWPACMSVRVSGSLELGLQTVVSAGNLTCVLGECS